MTARSVWATTRAVVGDSARSYSRHGGRLLAAAIAFSALLSIAPLLLIALGIAGAAIGDARSHAAVLHDLTRWIGEDGATTVFGLLERAGEHGRSGIAGTIGAIVLVYASTRLFSQMKRALNHMWDVHARSGRGVRGKVWKQLRKRGLALGMVLVLGAIIIVAVIIKTILAVATHPLVDRAAAPLAWAGELIVSLGATTVMFAAIFKILPDARLAWRDAWRGGLVTALLFSLGTTVIGLYLGHKTLDVLYGPGGSIVMLLLWVHYSAQVFFFGAAVTGELARRAGRAIEPNEYGAKIHVAEDNAGALDQL